MFSVTVRDHMMIAHSFRGDVFGPAQRLHGATYVVDATFRRADLDADGIVVDIGRATDELRAVLADLNFRNLDDEPDFAGMNTSTEALARVVADRLAASIHAGVLGEGARSIEAIVVTLHESHVAWASYERAVMSLRVIVPADIDDPARPSGGNAYDRRVLDGLTAAGTPLHEHAVGGAWPAPDGVALAGLAATLDAIADGEVALVDGLIASAAAAVLVPRAERLRLVVLVHLPFGDANVAARAGEGAVLHAATAVITTSAWARQRLIELYALPVERVHVAAPGVDPAALAPGSDDGGSLLCVAAVIPGKGHDVLLEALASLDDHGWFCTCVGTLERDPAFVAALRRRAHETGLDDRLHLVGPRIGTALERSYASADLLVHASRAETFGMVVTEALARGVPVLATAVGGVPEALGHAAGGTRPGVLVSPQDPAALTEALRAWLDDRALRGRLRAAARERRATLAGWETTTAAVGRVLEAVAR